MSVKLKIKVTKEILYEARLCGGMITNCAIARAVKTIFPQTTVGRKGFSPFKYSRTEIQLPEIAQKFILDFDDKTPDERVLMPEIEFEVSIPDTVLDQINIDEIRPLLINHPTLELV